MASVLCRKAICCAVFSFAGSYTDKRRSLGLKFILSSCYGTIAETRVRGRFGVTPSALILSAIHPPPVCAKETSCMEKKHDFWHLEVPLLACSQNELTSIQPFLNKGTLQLCRVMDGDVCLTSVDDESCC